VQTNSRYQHGRCEEFDIDQNIARRISDIRARAEPFRRRLCPLKLVNELRNRLQDRADIHFASLSLVEFGFFVERVQGLVCRAAILSRSCPLWVKSRHLGTSGSMSALPPKADID
jgi:hypothetical protein